MKLAITLLTLSACTLIHADSGIRWLNRVHDFGAFTEDSERISTDFKFVNETGEDVTILQVAATCGCTVPTYKDEVVAAGDTATIHVEYNPIGRPGRFDKSVYVRTSADHERYKLTIKGAVIGSPATVSARYPVDMGRLKLHTGAAMVGRVHKGKAKMEYVDGYNLSSDSIRPVFANVPDYIEISCVPEVVPPGELVNFNIYFRGDKAPDYGIITDSLQIAANAGDSLYTLPVVAIVEEDFTKLSAEQRKNAPSLSIVGERIDLGKVDANSKEKAKGSIKLLNRGNDPLLIRRVYSQDPAVSATTSATSIKKGKTAILSIEYDPSLKREEIVNTRVTIITNDPDNPTRTIRIVGE